MLHTLTRTPYKALYQCIPEEHALVRSPHVEDRLSAVDKGLGLDVLVRDRDAGVRASVACQGYGLERLVFDSDKFVRCEVARNQYGLDVLSEDDSPLVLEVVRNALAKEGMSWEAWAAKGRPDSGFTLAEWKRCYPHWCASGLTGALLYDPNDFAKYDDYLAIEISELAPKAQDFIRTEIIWSMREFTQTLDPPASMVKDAMNSRLKDLSKIVSTGPIISRLAVADSFDPHKVEVSEYAVLYITSEGPYLAECHLSEDEYSPCGWSWYFEGWEQSGNHWTTSGDGGQYWGYQNANELNLRECVPPSYHNILAEYAIPYSLFEDITYGDQDIKPVLESIKVEGRFNRFDAREIESVMNNPATKNYMLNNAIKNLEAGENVR